MAKTGPKTTDDLSNLHKIFESRLNKIVRDNGQIQMPSDKIWSTLKRQHKISKPEKALYNDCWRWNKIRQTHRTKDSSSDQSEIFDNELNSSLNEMSLTDSDYENDGQRSDAPKIAFSITLSSQIWKTIEPVPRKYSRAADKMHKSGERVFHALQPGTWTSLLAEKIAEHSKKIICNWSFKRAKVTPNGTHYISILAKCVTCASTLIGFLQSKPQDDEHVVFKFVVNGFDDIKHLNAAKSVKVTGSQARSLATSTKPAVVLHRKLSAKSGEMFEIARGRVPSAHAIRNIKYRERQKNKLSTDIFKSLYYLQNAPKYANIIQTIGYSPFYVFYGSPNQFSLYNMYLKKNKLSKMCCDATGGLMRKIGNYFKKLITNIHAMHEICRWNDVVFAYELKQLNT